MGEPRHRQGKCWLVLIHEDSEEPHCLSVLPQVIRIKGRQDEIDIVHEVRERMIAVRKSHGVDPRKWRGITDQRSLSWIAGSESIVNRCKYSGLPLNDNEEVPALVTCQILGLTSLMVRD